MADPIRRSPPQEGENPAARRQQRRRRRRQKLAHLFLCLGVSLGCLVILVLGGAAVINYGPSPAARDLFVVSMMETSAAKFLATLYFSPEEIQQILEANSVQEVTEVTDGSLVEAAHPRELFDIDRRADLSPASGKDETLWDM